ncbi:MAG: virulence RhuM family protein [Bacteroidales bacterium]|nr:virulence RhuM family protein [Bacteroidales bacterium]
MNKREIILYQPDNSIHLEVRMEEDTVWLTQTQMAQLFDCSTDNIGLHLKNLYDEGEINQYATTEEISVVRQEGNRLVTRKVRHNNLDAILSVGYRVSSKNGQIFDAHTFATDLIKSAKNTRGRNFTHLRIIQEFYVSL